MNRLCRFYAGLFFFLPLALCAAGGFAQEQKEITVAPQVLQQYVGVYELAPNFKITITAEGNQLMAQASGQARLPVYASSETKFFYKVVEAEIEFLKDAKGAVASLILRQNGREMPAPRVSDQVVMPKEVAVPPAILSQYVGTYQLAPKLNAMITLDGNQLMAQISGQGKSPVYASSETKFFYKTVDAQIEFFKDDKGAVSRLVLYQGQQEMNAPRISDTVAEKKEIAVSPAILSKYVGTYELQPGFDLVITLEGNQLMSQATNQGKIPIFAESETKFFPKVMDAEMEFLKDDKGAVTSLMLRQGLTEIKAPRK